MKLHAQRSMAGEWRSRPLAPDILHELEDFSQSKWVP